MPRKSAALTVKKISQSTNKQSKNSKWNLERVWKRRKSHSKSSSLKVGDLVEMRGKEVVKASQPSSQASQPLSLHNIFGVVVKRTETPMGDILTVQTTGRANVAVVKREVKEETLDEILGVESDEDAKWRRLFQDTFSD